MQRALSNEHTDLADSSKINHDTRFILILRDENYQTSFFFFNLRLFKNIAEAL